MIRFVLVSDLVPTRRTAALRARKEAVILSGCQEPPPDPGRNT